MNRLPLSTRAFGEAILKALRSFNKRTMYLSGPDRETLSRVESPVLNIPRRPRLSDAYPHSNQLNVYDGNRPRPTFKPPAL